MPVRRTVTTWLSRLVARRSAPRRVLFFGPHAGSPPSGPRRLAQQPVFRAAFMHGSAEVERRRGWSPWRALDRDEPPPGITPFESVYFRELLFQLSLFTALRESGIEIH